MRCYWAPWRSCESLWPPAPTSSSCWPPRRRTRTPTSPQVRAAAAAAAGGALLRQWLGCAACRCHWSCGVGNSSGTERPPGCRWPFAFRPRPPPRRPQQARRLPPCCPGLNPRPPPCPCSCSAVGGRQAVRRAHTDPQPLARLPGNPDQRPGALVQRVSAELPLPQRRARLLATLAKGRRATVPPTPASLPSPPVGSASCRHSPNLSWTCYTRSTGRRLPSCAATACSCERATGHRRPGPSGRHM